MVSFDHLRQSWNHARSLTLCWNLISILPFLLSPSTIYFVLMISWISYWLLTITFTISYHWTDVLVLHLNIYTFFGRLLIYYIDLSLVLGFNTMSTSESCVSIIQSGANKSFNLCYNVFLDIYVETIENKYSMMYYICP